VARLPEGCEVAPLIGLVERMTSYVVLRVQFGGAVTQQERAQRLIDEDASGCPITDGNRSPAQRATDPRCAHSRFLMPKSCHAVRHRRVTDIRSRGSRRRQSDGVAITAPADGMGATSGSRPTAAQVFAHDVARRQWRTRPATVTLLVTKARIAAEPAGTAKCRWVTTEGIAAGQGDADDTTEYDLLERRCGHTMTPRMCRSI
jgi:hypothetical protein